VIWRVSMVRIQKQVQGNYTVTISPALMRHCGWDKGTIVSLCPCENVLRIVPLKNAEV